MMSIKSDSYHLPHQTQDDEEKYDKIDNKISTVIINDEKADQTTTQEQIRNVSNSPKQDYSGNTLNPLMMNELQSSKLISLQQSQKQRNSIEEVKNQHNASRRESLNAKQKQVRSLTIQMELLNLGTDEQLLKIDSAKLFQESGIGLQDEHFFKEKVSLQFEEDQKTAIQVFQKPNHRRTDQEVFFLRRLFEPLNFFRDLKNEIKTVEYIQIFKQLRSEQIGQFRAVFYHGQIGKKFYILLQGECVVLIPNNAQQIDLHTMDMTPEQFVQNIQRYKSQHLTVKNILERLYPDNKFLNYVYPGGTFGDIALRTSGRRTATVICTKDCVFATLSTEQFAKILQGYYDQKEDLNQKISFLRHVSLFSGMEDSALFAILVQSKLLRFTRNQVIFSEHDLADKIYFIYSGEVQITKAVQHTFLNAITREKFITRVSNQFTVSRGDTDKAKQELDSFMPVRQLNMRWKKPTYQTYKRLCILSNSQYFGAEDLSEQHQPCQLRSVSAKCVSQECQVYAMDKDMFWGNYRLIQPIDTDWHRQYIQKGEKVQQQIDKHLIRKKQKQQILDNIRKEKLHLNIQNNQNQNDKMAFLKNKSKIKQPIRLCNATERAMINRKNKSETETTSIIQQQGVEEQQTNRTHKVQQKINQINRPHSLINQSANLTTLKRPQSQSSSQLDAGRRVNTLPNNIKDFNYFDEFDMEDFQYNTTSLQSMRAKQFQNDNQQSFKKKFQSFETDKWLTKFIKAKEAKLKGVIRSKENPISFSDQKTIALFKKENRSSPILIQPSQENNHINNVQEEQFGNASIIQLNEPLAHLPTDETDAAVLVEVQVQPQATQAQDNDNISILNASSSSSSTFQAQLQEEQNYGKQALKGQNRFIQAKNTKVSVIIQKKNTGPPKQNLFEMFGAEQTKMNVRDRKLWCANNYDLNKQLSCRNIRPFTNAKNGSPSSQNYSKVMYKLLNLDKMFKLSDRTQETNQFFKQINEEYSSVKAQYIGKTRTKQKFDPNFVSKLRQINQIQFEQSKAQPQIEDDYTYFNFKKKNKINSFF